MGRLYVVPTPIGNLEDITLRALRVLREVPVVLAEDTRHTRRLLTHYDIRTRLLSYHEHNERQRVSEVLELLERGDVALVSDAGMPAISDPGMDLVRAVAQAGREVEVLPGPSAAVTALVASAIPGDAFLFVGFLPRRSSERRARLAEIADVRAAIVLYEAPHRLVAALKDILSVLGDREMAAARELTKIHEEVVRGTVSRVLARFQETAPRGELTLVIAGAERSAAPDRGAEAAQEGARLRAAGHGRKETIEVLMREYGLSRNDAYRVWLEANAGS